MLSLFDPLRDVTLLSVTVRMLLAVICGGVIGIERECKRRPAGFRTHILICLGAAMTTLTSQYLFCTMHYYTDIGRLGAQVVAGIGFIGAGTIIVTRRQRVKGLTTAAGLWAAAIIGLAIGSGFYEGGLFATFLIFLAEVFFIRLEYRLLRNTPELPLYLEYDNKLFLEQALQLFHELDLKVMDLEITRFAGKDKANTSALLTLRLGKKSDTEYLLSRLREIEGGVSIQPL